MYKFSFFPNLFFLFFKILRKLLRMFYFRLKNRFTFQTKKDTDKNPCIFIAPKGDDRRKNYDLYDTRFGIMSS